MLISATEIFIVRLVFGSFSVPLTYPTEIIVGAVLSITIPVAFVEFKAATPAAVVFTAVILNIEEETFAFNAEVLNAQVTLPFVAIEVLPHNVAQSPNVPFHHLTVKL